jgi:transcriptional regulator with XRE-family HTH domain
VETHGELLRKLLKRKKLNTTQGAELLNTSRTTLNKWFSVERFDEILLEQIEKVFQVSPNYFPLPAIYKGLPPDEALGQASTEGNCWQLLVAAQAKIIDLQQQIIEMSKPSVNAPVGRQMV